MTKTEKIMQNWEENILRSRRLQAHLKAVFIEADLMLEEGKSMLLARRDGNYIFKKKEGQIIFSYKPKVTKSEPKASPIVWIDEYSDLSEAEKCNF